MRNEEKQKRRESERRQSEERESVNEWMRWCIHSKKSSVTPCRWTDVRIKKGNEIKVVSRSAIEAIAIFTPVSSANSSLICRLLIEVISHWFRIFSICSIYPTSSSSMFSSSFFQSFCWRQSDSLLLINDKQSTVNLQSNRKW